jgi:uncharacterized protein YbbK (DUF523 family)
LTAPIRIGISACLLGQEVRFDGGHKRGDRRVSHAESAEDAEGHLGVLSVLRAKYSAIAARELLKVRRVELGDRTRA